MINYSCVGVVAFEKKYDLWVVEQRKIESQLVSILQSDVSDDELRVFVDGVVNHYDELFRIKADAAKVDAFNLLYGSWKSPVERLFQWLGGFRPSEILYVSCHKEFIVCNTINLMFQQFPSCILVDTNATI